MADKQNALITGRRQQQTHDHDSQYSLFKPCSARESALIF